MTEIRMIEQPNTPSGAVMSDALAFIYRRHSTRSFTAAPVPSATIHILLEAAVHAPTAMYDEPWRFVVIQDRDVLERVSNVAKVLLTADAATHGRLLKPPGAAGDGIASAVAEPEFNIFHDAGTAVVICAESASEFTTADCWLAAENLMLGAAAIGLGTCCIGFAIPALNAADVKKALGIPATGRAVAAIVLGTPREGGEIVARRPPVVWKWIQPEAMVR